MEVIIPCEESQKELLLAALDGAGYNSIQETDEGLNAYILKSEFEKVPIENLARQYGLNLKNISWKEQEEQNWNKEWEKNFEPITINNLCRIRAPFHTSEPDTCLFELVILPKMSFGTGHHATTYLMIKNQILNIDHKGKKVLDAGCGTAILAVMAEKLGAMKITAYDIDGWSRDNAPENVDLNDCKNISVLQGTIKELNLEKDYEVILANINKNVLLDELDSYFVHLMADGMLLLSGFYLEDIDDINNKALSMGFEKVCEDSKDRWACLLYKKQG